MLKMFIRYLSGDECGLQFEARYITGTMPETQPTEAQAAGQWFEYMCTGATPRNSGIIPEPVRIKSGELNAMYRTLSNHLTTWERLRPSDAKFGVEISNETAIFGHELVGITDVKTPDLIGDIKVTGLIDNKWEEFGWGGDADNLKEKQLLFQAKYYTLIEWLNTGKILPFWFWVFANNSDKVKQILVTMSDASVASFLKDVEYLIQALEDEVGNFKPITTYARCNSCPLSCSHRQTSPDIIEINL